MIKRYIREEVGKHEIDTSEAHKVWDVISLLTTDFDKGARQLDFEIEAGEGYVESCYFVTSYQRLETDEEEAEREEEERKAAERRPIIREQMYQQELARLNRKYGK